MIKEVTRFTLVCDGCGKELGSAWRTEVKAEVMAGTQNWIKNINRHYCPDCWHYDGEILLFKIPQK